MHRNIWSHVLLAMNKLQTDKASANFNGLLNCHVCNPVGYDNM